MAQHPRSAVLAAFAAAFQSLDLQPTIFTDLVKQPTSSQLPALNIGPGEEPVEKYEHGEAGEMPPNVRRLRVHVVCTADSQVEADELAWQVEQAAPYETAGLGASYAGSDFAGDAAGDRPVHKTRVNFDVLYEASAS